MASVTLFKRPEIGDITIPTTKAGADFLRSLLKSQMGMDLHWESSAGSQTGIISAGTAPTYTFQARSCDVYMAATTLGSYCVNIDGNGSSAQKQLFLPGSIGNVTAGSITVDWTKSWMMRLVMVNYLGAVANGMMTVQIGVDAALRSHTLANKSVGFRVTEGASAATIAVIAHTGTGGEQSQNAAATSDVARTFTDKTWELLYIAGSGLYLYCDGTLLAELDSTKIPTGSGAAGHHTLQIAFASGGASSGGIKIRIEQIQFYRF